VEYKGQLSVCPECGELLTETLPEELEDPLEGPEEGMVCRHRSPDQAQSEELEEALKEAEIQYFFKPLRRVTVTGAFDGEFYVHEDAYEEAREVAESILGEIEEEI
jgi:hypothetical protein